MNPQTQDEADIHSLQCMEIWGGNEAAENAISVPGIDAWIRSRPYHEQASGGDIHYVSMCAAGKIARFAVADVSGHGDTVGLVAGKLRDLMRRNINTLDQSKFARALNREFAGQSGAGQFATAILATYFAPTDHLLVVNAGHPRPLVYSASAGEWSLAHEDVDWSPDGVPSGLPLGVIDPTEYHQFAMPLTRGDIILIYTDAIMEASDANGRQLGEEGLLQLARQLDPADPASFSDAMLNAVDAFRDSDEAIEDDVTVLTLHHNAADPPRMSLGEKFRVMTKMMGLRD